MRRSFMSRSGSRRSFRRGAKCSSFEFFDWLEVCYARWNSAVVFFVNFF